MPYRVKINSRNYVKINFLSFTFCSISARIKAFLSERLTVEGQVSEEGGQQVHDEHGQEGHIGNALHLLAGAAVWEGECLI